MPSKHVEAHILIWFGTLAAVLGHSQGNAYASANEKCVGHPGRGHGCDQGNARNFAVLLAVLKFRAKFYAVIS